MSKESLYPAHEYLKAFVEGKLIDMKKFSKQFLLPQSIFNNLEKTAELASEFDHILSRLNQLEYQEPSQVKLPGKLPEGFSPGSEKWNDMVDFCESLQAQITELEGKV